MDEPLIDMFKARIYVTFHESIKSAMAREPLGSGPGSELDTDVPTFGPFTEVIIGEATIFVSEGGTADGSKGLDYDLAQRVSGGWGLNDGTENAKLYDAVRCHT